MDLIADSPILFLCLLLAVAAVLIGLGIRGIAAAGRKGKDRYIFLSNTAQLRRKYAERRDREGRHWAFIYAGLSFHRMRNTYSQTDVDAVYDHVQQILLTQTYRTPEKLIARCDGKNFLIMTREGEVDFSAMMEEFFTELERYASVQGIVRLPEIHFGCYAALSHDVEFDEAVSRAKQACKYAESSRKNGCVWDYETLRSEREVEELERQISSAIESDAFFLEFQPFVDAETETVIGGEVLTRLNLPNRSLAQPARFLRAIAGIGLHSKFDYYIFNKCCGWLACQLGEGRTVRHLSCNFSRYTLSLPDFAQTILRIADQHGVPHGILDIEVTEEEQETESAQITRNLEQLHQAGFSVFLDDFGCGFTSFNDLQHYPIDVVKVDKSLLDRAVTEKGLVIFRHVVSLARDLGCAVLCEGVETEAQLKLARESGCDIVQGFYYYRSLPAEDFKTLLPRSGEETEPPRD